MIAMAAGSLLTIRLRASPSHTWKKGVLCSCVRRKAASSPVRAAPPGELPCSPRTAGGDKNEPLEDYLSNKVFAEGKSTIMAPDSADVAGFAAFLKRYKEGLPSKGSPCIR